MTLLKHELRQGRSALCIWTAIIASMTALCVLIYPEIRDQMSAVSGMFSDMGVFSAAFGMDKLNFGEFLGFFGVECGNILGLGGSFFAALLGAQALAKEEKDGTAEFLLTHPISRSRILLQKLSALFLQIALLNLVVIGVVLLSVTAIGRTPEPSPSCSWPISCSNWKRPPSASASPPLSEAAAHPSAWERRRSSISSTSSPT